MRAAEPDGRHYWLELKRAKAPLSEAQERFRQELVDRTEFCDDGSGGSGLSLRCNLHPVDELYTEDDFRQLIGTVQPAPIFLCGLGELEDHSERSLVRETPLGAHRSVADGRERAFDGIGRAQMLPVLGREVIEASRASLSFVHGIARSFDAPGLDEGVEATSASFFVSAIQISWSARLAFDCWLFGNLLSTLAVLCTQQRWLRVFGQTSSTACQKPRAPSATARCGPMTSPRRFRSRSSSLRGGVLSRTPS